MIFFPYYNYGRKTTKKSLEIPKNLQIDFTT